MRNGRLYERLTSERRIAGSDCLSWPTPKASQRGDCPSERRRHTPGLETAAVQNWPTHDAGVSQQSNRSPSPGASDRPNLAKLAKTWSTPRAGCHGQAGGRDDQSLESQTKNWATPRSHEVGDFQNDRGDKSSPRPTLTGQAKNWATPNARDWKSEDGTHSPSHSPPLGRQVLKKENGGKAGMALNPQFVEILMGFPIGWTDCAALETPSSRSKPPSHSAS